MNVQQVKLLPGQCKVIQHLVPAFAGLEWSWKHAPLIVNTFELSKPDVV